MGTSTKQEEAVSDQMMFQLEPAGPRTGELTDPSSNPAFSKARELVEIVPVEGTLSLVDRRLYNKLLYVAFNELERGEEFKVRIVDLRGRHKGADRIIDSISRLQTTLVRINYLDSTGQKIIGKFDQVQLLGKTRIRGAYLLYRIDPELVPILVNPTVCGRINMVTQDSFQSKYGLILWELLQSRAVLMQDGFCRWKVKVADCRALFDTQDQYPNFADFSRRCIAKAVNEINAFTELRVDWSAAKSGKAYESIEFTWRRATAEEVDAEFDIIPSPVDGDTDLIEIN
jgi:hypothetical protein